jgi:hypothetical protein
MTGWGVERWSRAAFPASSVPGVPPLMPPPSQGMDRRTERRAPGAGSRWGTRVFVIGGLAGAAWLLTCVAAHAADRDPAPGGFLGTSVIGSVVDGDVAGPAVGRVLQAADQSLESDRPAHRRHHASVHDGPERNLTRPIATLTHPKRDARGFGVVVREITGPLRLTGGPADSLLASVTAALARTPDPVRAHAGLAGDPVDLVSGILPHAAISATSVHRLVSAVLPHAVVPGLTAQRPGNGMQPHAAAPATVQRPVATPLPGRPAAVSGNPARRGSRTITDRHVVVAESAMPETVRESTPDSDGPAPTQGHLGAVSGLSTGGSGVPTGGGSAALRPAAVAASSMAIHRLPIATDVEVRRHDAEAPTVSPD